MLVSGHPRLTTTGAEPTNHRMAAGGVLLQQRDNP